MRFFTEAKGGQAHLTREKEGGGIGVWGNEAPVLSTVNQSVHTLAVSAWRHVRHTSRPHSRSA